MLEAQPGGGRAPAPRPWEPPTARSWRPGGLYLLGCGSREFEGKLSGRHIAGKAIQNFPGEDPRGGQEEGGMLRALWEKEGGLSGSRLAGAQPQRGPSCLQSRPRPVLITCSVSPCRWTSSSRSATASPRRWSSGLRGPSPWARSQVGRSTPFRWASRQ